MVRTLHADPVRRRKQMFRSLYQHMPHWREQIIAGKMDDIIVTPDGEEVCYTDLLVGLDSLSLRQRQAFELICMQGYTETAAAKIMLPESKWSTTVQQHVNAAVERMIAKYDEHQSGVFVFQRRLKVLMSLHPIIESNLKTALKAAKAELQSQMDGLKSGIAQVDQMLKESIPGKDGPAQ